MTEQELREKLVGKVLISQHDGEGKSHYDKITKVGDLCDGMYRLELKGGKDDVFFTPLQLNLLSINEALALRDTLYMLSDARHDEDTSQEPDEATAKQSTVMQGETDWEERTYTLSEQLFLQGRKAKDAIHTAQEFIKAYKEKMEGEV